MIKLLALQPLRVWVLFAFLFSPICGCIGDSDPAPSSPDSQGEDIVAADIQDLETPDTENHDIGPIAGDCDPLMEAICAMPWPSNRYLAPDPTRSTGYRLSFPPTALPANILGNPVDPAPYLQLDGYGVGSPILVHFPQLNASLLPGEESIEDSLAADAPILLFEEGDGGLQRLPYFAEIDLTEDDESRRALIIRPAVILREGTRYLVAMRNLETLDGESIAPSDAFVALRDGDTKDDPALAPRQARFDLLLTDLEEEGIDRNSLVLAWDFVTASTEALHSKMLFMRDEALSMEADDGPTLTLDEVIEYTEEENADIAVEMRATLRVPFYMQALDFHAQIGWVFNLDEDGNPNQNDWEDAPVWIRIPRSALDSTPHGLMIYGHGLNGSGSQVRGSFNGRIANMHNLIVYATDMWGMHEDNVSVIMAMLADLSYFPALSDLLHQGMLNYLLLTRAMRDQFPSLPEVVDLGIVVNTDDHYYSGISQGGIFGGTYMALSTDITRGHLGVPGQNYSILLQRSVDFDPFFFALDHIYPDSREQQILLAAVQCLWDRVDSVSHYRHISEDPFPGTPEHAVLLASATGDYQVALVTNEITARSDLGVALMAHYGKPVSEVEETSYPHTGSGLVNYSFGNPWPPVGNLPPTDTFGDPHGKPRKLDHHNEQMIHFFHTGEIIDVCGGDGCTPD